MRLLLILILFSIPASAQQGYVGVDMTDTVIMKHGPIRTSIEWTLKDKDGIVEEYFRDGVYYVLNYKSRTVRQVLDIATGIWTIYVDTTGSIETGTKNGASQPALNRRK